MDEQLNILILAAGLGTRLRPLTLGIPKPLVPIADTNILEIQTKKAREISESTLHVNTHYLSSQIESYGKSLKIECIWNEPEILGTAAPLKRIYNAGYRGGLLVLNGDAYHEFDLKKFLRLAKKSGADISLLAVDNPKVNTFQIDEQNNLVGVLNQFGKKTLNNTTFSGISWYNDSALLRMKENEFDIRKFWKAEIEKGNSIFVDTSQKNCLWIDTGSPEGLKKATDAYLKKLNRNLWWGDFPDVLEADFISKKGFTSIEKDVEIPKKVYIENSILFKGAEISEGEFIQNEIRGKKFVWKI